MLGFAGALAEAKNIGEKSENSKKMSIMALPAQSPFSPSIIASTPMHVLFFPWLNRVC